MQHGSGSFGGDPLVNRFFDRAAAEHGVSEVASVAAVGPAKQRLVVEADAQQEGVNFCDTFRLCREVRVAGIESELACPEIPKTVPARVGHHLVEHVLRLVDHQRPHV